MYLYKTYMYACIGLTFKHNQGIHSHISANMCLYVLYKHNVT